jgi:DNA repair protein RecN (Recombination protein N)
VLKSLYIKNHALIDEMEVKFEGGLNVLTGETGAGKSTIIEALSLILGERASADVVRKGAEKAVVEGLLQVSGNRKLKKLLEENQLEFSDELFLRREVSLRGQSRCFVNDTPTTLSILAQVGDLLVDLHGQHQHQSLLKVDTHIDQLDEFGETASLLSDFQRSYERLRGLVAKLHELQQREQQLKEKRELYEFQMKEIDAVNPRPGEEEELEQELKILENSERLHESTTQLYGLLYESDSSLYDRLASVNRMLQDLAKIDKTFEEGMKEASSAQAIVGELAKTVHTYQSRIEFSPERLEKARERLGSISLLKKKYGGSLDSVLEHRRRIGAEVDLAETFDEALKKLQDDVEKERSISSEAAQKLSSKRKEAAKRLNKSIVEELADLGIPNATFEARIGNRMLSSDTSSLNSSLCTKLGKTLYDTNPKGIDFVEFYISTNVGEDLKPLSKVASGGEISRIMLALKSILAKADRLPLLIFDEIDIGISGRIAQTVGMSLKSLSKFHQIIVITHLPQIAGTADHHYVVEKIEAGRRAFTRIRRLSLDDRVREVARLLSGEKVTDAGLKGARELIGSVSKN